jgi:hypothetical protein
MVGVGGVGGVGGGAKKMVLASLLDPLVFAEVFLSFTVQICLWLGYILGYIFPFCLKLLLGDFLLLGCCC